MNCECNCLCHTSDFVCNKCRCPDPLPNEIIQLEKRIKELERFQDITHLEYKNTKKPHKCPICEGEGLNKSRLVMDAILEQPSTISMKNPDCKACEGKGIVWG